MDATSDFVSLEMPVDYWNFFLKKGESSGYEFLVWLFRLRAQQCRYGLSGKYCGYGFISSKRQSAQTLTWRGGWEVGGSNPPGSTFYATAFEKLFVKFETIRMHYI